MHAMTLTGTTQRSHVSMGPPEIGYRLMRLLLVNTRLSHCIKVIDAWRSAGKRPTREPGLHRVTNTGLHGRV